MTIDELIEAETARYFVKGPSFTTEVKAYERIRIWSYESTGRVGDHIDSWIIGGELPFISLGKEYRPTWVDGLAGWCFLMSDFYDKAKKGKILKSFGLKDPYTGEPYSPTRDEAKREQVYVDYVCDEILIHHMGDIQKLKTLVRLYSPEDRIKWLGAERAREIQLELGLSDDE
jgi:hypothetical protein